MANQHEVRVRQVYDESEEGGGRRVLVDRIWPRGVTKATADLYDWCKTVAPSTELRKWYGHDPKRFDEFARRYLTELKEPEAAAGVGHLAELAEQGPLTLLTATKHPEISEAKMLADLVRG